MISNKSQELTTSPSKNISTQKLNTYNLGIKPTRILHNIYNISVFPLTVNEHLIINHGEDLLLYNSKTREIMHTAIHTHGPHYINFTYSAKWKCIFLLESNQNIKIYSSNELILLASDISLKQVKHCLDFVYVDEYSAFLVLFPEHIKLVYVEINANHLRSMFQSSYQFKIRQIHTKTMDEKYYLPYSSKLMKIQEYVLMWNREQVKIIWHSGDRNFHQKQKKQNAKFVQQEEAQYEIRDHHEDRYFKNTVFDVIKICEFPELLTAVYFDHVQGLLLCGTNHGKLKVLRINIKNISVSAPISLNKDSKSADLQLQSKNYLLFELLLHNGKPIQNISMYSCKVILTLGSDENIEVISCEQMSSIERFRSSTNLKNINFINNYQFIAIKTIEFDQYLYSFDINLDYELLLNHNSQIICKICKNGLCIFALSDNSLNVLKPVNQKQAEFTNSFKQSTTKKNQTLFNNRIITKQSFTPPACKSILAIEIYPYSNNEQSQQFWILTDKSQVYHYICVEKTYMNSSFKQESKQFEIIGMHSLQRFEDIYNHSTKYKIISMKFLDVVPIAFDADVKERKYEPNFENVKTLKPVAFGSATGEFMICPSTQPTKIICRIRNFVEPVKCIGSCFLPDIEYVPIFRQDFKNQGMTEQIILTQKNRGINSRKVVAFCSKRQIVVYIISNCQIPHLIFKFSLDFLSHFEIKNIGSRFIAILSGTHPKLIFPSPANPQILRLWMPATNLHETSITCLNYCYGDICISGDQNGKIVLWNLSSQILAVINTSQKSQIEICYFYQRKIVFGYSSKIFHINISIDKFKRKRKQGESLSIDQQWINEYTNQLNANTNLSKIFKPSYSSDIKFLEQKVQTQKLVEKEDNKLRNREVHKYIHKMKGSLIKLSKQAEAFEGYENFKVDNTINSNRKLEKDNSYIKIDESDNNINVRTLSKSVFKEADQQNQVNSNRIARAKFLLDKFKQTQEKTMYEELRSSERKSHTHDFSLPEIKHYSKTIDVKKQETKYKLYSPKKPRNRSNKHEFKLNLLK